MKFYNDWSNNHSMKGRSPALSFNGLLLYISWIDAVFENDQNQFICLTTYYKRCENGITTLRSNLFSHRIFASHFEKNDAYGTVSVV